MMKMGTVIVRQRGEDDKLKEHKFTLFGKLFKYNIEDDDKFFSFHFSVKNREINVTKLLEYIVKNDYEMWISRNTKFSKGYMAVFYEKIFISKRLDKLDDIVEKLKKMKLPLFEVQFAEEKMNIFVSQETARML